MILVVEDEPLVRILLADVLTEAGFKVREAADAEEALQILNAGLDVSVLVTDVDMPPGIDGYALTRQVSANWPDIQIIVTSGRQWPQEGDLPEGAAFLAKPVPNEVLVSYVKAASERVAQRNDQQAEGETVVPFLRTA